MQSRGGSGASPNLSLTGATYERTKNEPHWCSSHRSPFFAISDHFERNMQGDSVMPYKDIADLPKAQTDQYDRHQKEAFLKAFNNAYEEYGHDESRAFAVAHHAAKQAGKKEGAT
jgi:cation transport regulator